MPHVTTTEIKARYGVGAPYLEQWSAITWYDDAFTDEECDKVLELYKDIERRTAVVGKQDEAEVNESMRKSDVSWIYPNPDNFWMYDLIGHYAQEANTYRWRMDIGGFQEPLQFSHYGPNGGHYGWHLDIGQMKPSLRKLSFSLILQNADKGGELAFLTSENETRLNLKRGTIVFFPSYILHKVYPVTAGDRFSIVGWLGGEHYR
jgi:PKHD-type hydroxylase